MIARSTFLCLLVVFISACLAQQKQQTLPTIFHGVWHIQITAQKQVDGKLAPSGDELNFVLNVTEEDASKHTAVFADWERELSYKITVDWLSVTSGELRIAALTAQAGDDQENEEMTGSSEYVQAEKDQLLFEFDFMNRTNSYLFSQGEFLGVNNKYVGSYQMIFPSSAGFIFSAISKDGSEILTITGGKNVVVAEQQWWQKLMGSPIAIVVIFMVMRMFLTRQMGGGGGGTGTATATGTGTGTPGLEQPAPTTTIKAATTGSKNPPKRAAKSSPTIEDVTDDKKND